MTFTGDQLLDLEDTSRRNESVRFELLDASNALQGTVEVAMDPRPSLAHDVGAEVIRRLDNVLISPSDINDVNTLSDRIRPVWVLGAGGPGYEYNLGIYLFADEDEEVLSSGSLRETTLVDQGLLFTNPLPETVSYPTGTVITDALIERAGVLGIIDTAIVPSAATLSGPLTYTPGRDTEGDVMRGLSKAAGYLRPYFGNDGELVCRPVPDLATASPDHSYGAGTGTTGRVVAGSIHSANGLLAAPNRYVVVDTSAEEVPLVGVFDVPDDAPHSFANTSRWRVRSENVQGLADQASADAAAVGLYASEASVFASITFRSPVDPRHDTYDVVAFDAVNHLEQIWRIPLGGWGRDGPQMDHDIRRLYQ